MSLYTYNPRPVEEKDKLGALAWYGEHRDHVNRMLAHYVGGGFPPSGSDCLHPELWKPGHWKWLLEQ